MIIDPNSPARIACFHENGQPAHHPVYDEINHMPHSEKSGTSLSEGVWNELIKSADQQHKAAGQMKDSAHQDLKQGEHTIGKGLQR